MIFFKLNSFPQVSETFIVTNLIYAKQNGFKLKILVDRYLGLENSSQKELLQQYDINKDIVASPSLNKSSYINFFQVIKMLSHWKVSAYTWKYYKLKRKKNLTPLTTLYQYRNLNNSCTHVHFNTALKPLVELSRIGFINPKCIVTFHGYDAFIETKESFQHKYGEFYVKHVVAVTVNSAYLKQKVIKLGIAPSKITIIPIGIDFSRFQGLPKSLSQSKSIRLLTVGRLVQLKGQLYGIQALKLLLDKGYNVNYDIVGAGNYESILKAEVERLNLSDNVYFLGSQSQSEVIETMKGVDLFIMPSTYDDLSNRREAFGLVSLEAQAIGLPVVGFVSGGFPDTIIEGKTGYAVEDRNENALAEKIEFLLEHPEVFETMSKAAIENAKTFDLKFTTQKYLDLYEKYQ
jgi:colanic acid/amylovoran biosynthesis glycosyltransferase